MKVQFTKDGKKMYVAVSQSFKTDILRTKFREMVAAVFDRKVTGSDIAEFKITEDDIIGVLNSMEIGFRSHIKS